MNRVLKGLASALVVLGIAPCFATAQVVPMSKVETARLLSLGPWPAQPVTDDSNAADGTPAAIALGGALFFEPALSACGEKSCASCHDPKRGFQDGKQFAGRHGRDTPGLFDVGLNRWFGWDGAADSLWAASLAPLVAPDEIGATVDTALNLLSANALLGHAYTEIFGEPQANKTLLVNMAKALAAWQATLVSPRTAFDDFRDGLANNDRDAIERYPIAAQRGARLFVGEGRCFLCHAGPRFTNAEFADIGRPFFSESGVDSGRWGGVKALLGSPWNRLGQASDAGADSPQALSTRHVLLEPRLFGEFKVPGLRGLTATAPYFHDGSAQTLLDVIEHYSELDPGRIHADGAQVLRPLHLSERQKRDLLAFLESLSK